ncbi:MAG: immune inhibitor A, partial [Candidatus Cloacimonadaceae bacterium]
FDTYAAMTDAAGNFAMPSIPQDTYDVIISANGFGVYNNTFQLENIRQIFILPDPIFLEDFETGLDSWTVQAPWAIVNHNGELVLTDSPTGNYGNNLNVETALSNPVSLENVTNATLSFDLKYSLENNYDFLFVYVSANGTDWFELAYFTGVNQNWVNYSHSLQNYEGGNLYLKFHLSTDPSVNADGVYLDNIMISGLSTVQTVYGDTDANWILNWLDVTNILQYSVGNDPIPLIDGYPWSDFRLEAADVDNDNLITATDAYYIYHRFGSFSAFPTQGGAAITFNDPMLTAANGNQECQLYFLANPHDLKSLTLNFSSDEALTVNDIEWVQPQNFAIAASSDLKNISAIVINDAGFTSSLLTMSFTTAAEVIFCSGLVNDIPVSFYIGTTSNDDNLAQPVLTEILGNYPNPFNPDTTIRFSIAKDNTPVRLLIYNSKGQLVRTLVNTNLDKGFHSLYFDGTDNHNNTLGNGIYFYRLVTPDTVSINKMVILK